MGNRLARPLSQDLSAMFFGPQLSRVGHHFTCLKHLQVTKSARLHDRSPQISREVSSSNFANVTFDDRLMAKGRNFVIDCNCSLFCW